MGTKRVGFTVIIVLLLGACGQQSEADTFANQSPPPVSSKAAAEAADRLAQEVTRVFNIVTPSPHSQMAMAVLELRAVDDFMAACMSKTGQPYARRTRQFSSAWYEPHGTLAAWWAPPFAGNPANGLGIAGPIVKDGPDSDPVITEDLKLTPTDQQVYDAAETDCAAVLPDIAVVDWGPINDLEGQMAMIARDTKNLSQFGPLAESYRDCVLASDLEFDDPDTLLDIVKQNYTISDDQSKAVEFERRVSVLDAECRSPIWPAFLQLAESDWRDFLDHNAEAIESVAETWRRVEREAGPIKGVDD
jgi:hypothetical protein